VRRPLCCRGGRERAAVATAPNGRSAERRAKLVAASIAEALAVGARKPVASALVRVPAAMLAVASGPATTREQASARMMMSE
jgi:hypothetical protein